MVDNELRWKEEQVLYRDQSSKDDKFRAVAFDSKNRFYCNDGKVVFEYDGSCYDVEPATFSKRISKDVFPRFVAKER